MTEVKGPIIGTVLLAGINPAGEPKYIDGTVLVAGLNANGKMEYLDPDNIGGGGGAPTDAQYVVGAANSSLSAELVLGTAVIMSGTIGARPAASLAGRLYYATDDGTLYRDTGAAWVKVGTLGESLITRTVVPGGGAASITFSSLPTTFEDLRISVMGRTDQAATNTEIKLQFNGDTGTNYDWQKAGATSTTFNGSGSTAGAAWIEAFNLTGASGPAGAAGQAIIHIYAYARTVFEKCTTGISVLHHTDTTNYVHARAGWWRDTAAITSITLTPASGNFIEGTVVSLFGVN